jgi:hypothetical protein
MKKVSVRTLLLLVELLAVVAVHQFLMWTPPAGAAVVWLDGAPDEPVDPNAAPDPNEPEDPQPESIGTVAARVWLDEEPVDPNTPEEPGNPQPEAVFPAPVLCGPAQTL